MNYVKPDRPKLRSLMAATLAGAMTVALYSLCFPPFNLPYLAWFAPVPLLVVIPRLSLRGDMYRALRGRRRTAPGG